MANIKISALAELTAPVDGDMLPINDVSEAGEKTKRILFSTLRKAAMADADGDTKITVDASSDEDFIRFYTGSGGQQLWFQDGYVVPAVDNDVLIGTLTNRFHSIHVINYLVNSTYYATMPTNGVSSNAKFMLGDSNTIIWFYNNSAPPGWKIVGTADNVIRVGATGGVTSGTWTISGVSAASGLGQNWAYPPVAQAGVSGASAPVDHNHVISVSTDGAWRPLGYIGKLFQLDTA